MPHVECIKCSAKFYAKPRHLKKGWGKFCSQKCQFSSQRNGKYFHCDICQKIVYRSKRQIAHSRIGKFFCNKSCFAVWKNANLFIGENHARWLHGENAYRNIMKRSGIEPICSDCGINNFKVLVVHHIDRNRKNNLIDNLKWLCFNCHHLEHLNDRKNMEALV